MRSFTLGASVLVLSAAALVGCTNSGTPEPSPSGSAAKCQTAKGDELVVLQDDKHLQTVDNIIPAVYQKVFTPALVGAVDKVGGALDTDKLIGLNKQVDIERKTPANVAQAFVSDNNLTAGLSGGSGDIQVGAANFGESKILANAYALVLNAAGFQATVKDVGNRELYLKSLSKGDIDVMPEYVGTLTEFLNKQQNGPNAPPKASADLDATVTALKELGAKANLSFGAPSQAADQNAFAVTKAFADANGLKTLSDLASKCSGSALVLAGPPECQERPFCKPGLEQTYGLKFTGFQSLDLGPLTKAAIKQGKATIGLVLSSDGSLASG